MSELSDIAVIAPAGDIDITTVPILREQLDALLDAGTRRVIIGCQNVDFIDSSGLALLLSRTRRMLAAGGVLSLANASRQVLRIFQIAQLVDVLHVSAADKPPLPVLAPGEMPRWSRTMQVPAGVEHLCDCRRRVSELLDEVAMGDDARFDAALAAGEALSNAYDHADGAGSMLSVRAYSDRVVVEVRDRGCGFEIAPDEDIEASEERGRGIRLMRMLMDSVEVRRRDDGVCGTSVRLVKLLDPVAL